MIEIRRLVVFEKQEIQCRANTPGSQGWDGELDSGRWREHWCRTTSLVYSIFSAAIKLLTGGVTCNKIP